jgi:hypothetical protein
MFEGWGEFYLLVGSAGAVLIGLLFVVVTLMQDRPRSNVVRGAKLYMGPIVLHVSLIMTLSAAALSHGITAGGFAILSGAVALWGLARSVRVTVGIRAFTDNGVPADWTDAWCYGIIPAALYLLLGGVAIAFWSGQAWAPQGVAAVIVALLLTSIRNEWDLVVWLAPKPDAPGTPFEEAD